MTGTGQGTVPGPGPAAGSAATRRPGPLVRRLLRAPARLYDWNLGWLLGHRFLRLAHVGRKSGRTYRTMLEVVGGSAKTGEFIVISGLGSQADWYRNLQANPAVEVAIAARRFKPAHRVLDEAEAVSVIADYERRNRLVTPILRRVLTWLVGWPYDGSEESRSRLVRELPLVGFRPTTESKH